MTREQKIDVAVRSAMSRNPLGVAFYRKEFVFFDSMVAYGIYREDAEPLPRTHANVFARAVRQEFAKL